MENYTAKQGGDGIVAEDAKWLLRTGQLTSNMMYTGYILSLIHIFGKVGNDMHGKFLKRTLQNEGINTCLLYTSRCV